MHGGLFRFRIRTCAPGIAWRACGSSDAGVSGLRDTAHGPSAMLLGEVPRRGGGKPSAYLGEYDTEEEAYKVGREYVIDEEDLRRRGL